MKSAKIQATVVWLILMTATLASWHLGHTPGFAGAKLAPLAAAGILLLAFSKIGLVMAWFMDVRAAPRVLAALCTVWCTILCAVMILIATH